jgi:zinc protease
MLRPFVETYVASLPATRAGETWRDVGVRPPTGVVTRTVEKGIAPKSEVGIVFSGPFTYDPAHRVALRALALVLQGRLFDTIRQELGGTYSIEAEQFTQKFPQPTFTVRIGWTCDPARTNSLVDRVFEEIRFVQRTALTDAQMTRIRSAMLRNVEQASEDNSYLLNEIVRTYQDGEADRLASALDPIEGIATLTSDAILEAARTYLNEQNYVKVVLMPETK